MVTITPSPQRGSSSLFAAIERMGPGRLVFWTIVLSTILRIGLGMALGYGYGESYYLATARHPALSFFDQPPLSLWIAALTVKAAGIGCPLLPRLPFIAMSAVSIWLMYRIGAELFGPWAGAWAAFLLNLTIVFGISVSNWVQPDGPLFLFMLAATLPVIRLCFGRPKHPLGLWAATGFLYGLALLSKYHAVLAFGGLLIFLASAPGHRSWFFHRGLFLAAAIAGVLFSPVILWNSQNGWVSFFFQGDRIVESAGLRFDWLLRSIAGQALLISPLIWPPLMVVLFQGLRTGPGDSKRWFLCCLAVIPILLFTLAALWAPLGWHFHWQAPGYLFLFPLLGRAVARRLEQGDRRTRRWLSVTTAFMLAVVVFLGTQAMTGWVHGILPERFQKRPHFETNPTRELLTWRELRGALAAEGWIPREKLFAVVPTWSIAGKVDVEVGDDLPVVCLSHDPRNIAFGWDHRRFIGWDALIITTSDTDTDPVAAYGAYFRELRPAKSIHIRLGGKIAMTIHVHYARDYLKPFPMPLPPRRPS